MSCLFVIGTHVVLIKNVYKILGETSVCGFRESRFMGDLLKPMVSTVHNHVDLKHMLSQNVLLYDSSCPVVVLQNIKCIENQHFKNDMD